MRGENTIACLFFDFSTVVACNNAKINTIVMVYDPFFYYRITYRYKLMLLISYGRITTAASSIMKCNWIFHSFTPPLTSAPRTMCISVIQRPRLFLCEAAAWAGGEAVAYQQKAIWSIWTSTWIIPRTKTRWPWNPTLCCGSCRACHGRRQKSKPLKRLNRPGVQVIYRPLSGRPQAQKCAILADLHKAVNRKAVSRRLTRVAQPLTCMCPVA